jgi:hypothetical protein
MVAVTGETARTWSRVSHALIAVVVLAAFVIQLVLVFVGGADANSGRDVGALSLGTRLVRLFSYFTIESNLIVLVTATLLALRPMRDGKIWRIARLDGLLGIVITGLVFAIVLAPQVHLTGAALVATIGFHYIAPWATLAAWLLFGPRPRLTWAVVAAAFVWPCAWLVYIFVQGGFTRWYPYPFLDATALGTGTALRNALLVLVIGVVIAVAFKLLDARLPSPGVKKS